MAKIALALLLTAFGVPSWFRVDTRSQEQHPQENETLHPEPEWVLAPAPDTEFDPSPRVATDAQAKEIRDLIESLLSLDRRDFGVASGAFTNPFAPVPASCMFEGGIFGIDDELEMDESVLKLVSYGPKALPFLLDAMDDPRLTKIRITHDFGFGAMWHVCQVPHNRADPRERRAVLDHGLPSSGTDDGVGDSRRTYEATLGDVAFFIVGQIVNRRYLPVSAVPTACIVINSPTTNRELARFVRTVWGSGDSTSALFRSLTNDLRTRGDGSDRFQTGAVLRLMTYFPDEARDMVVERLLGLKVALFEGDDWLRQRQINGVYPHELLEAASQVQDEQVDAALDELIYRIDSPSLLACAMNARTSTHRVDDFVQHARQLIRNSQQRPAPFGGEFDLLVKALRHLPDKAELLFTEALSRNDAAIRHGALHALRTSARVPWAVSVASPLLNDKTELDRTYSVTGAQDRGRRLHVRVCDEAALTIAHHLEEATFEQVGTHADLDEQIARIQELIR